MITDKTIELLKGDEGCKLRPYKDTEGFLTFGWGHNFDAKPAPQEVADLLLKYDAKDAEDDARMVVSNYDDLNEVRQAVLTDMAFNLGRSGLAEYRKMIAAIVAGDFKTASAELLDSQAARQLVGRYHRLSILLETGEWLA